MSDVAGAPAEASLALGDVTVAMMTRAAVPGRVKTRLAAGIGDAAALRVHGALETCTFRLVAAAVPGAVHLWIDIVDAAASGGSRRPRRRFVMPDRAPHVDELAARTFTPPKDGPPWKAKRQPAGDLGSRMRMACEAGLAERPAVLLIGTDCPARRVEDLVAGAQALADHAVVLQPATDGGYVMVGLRRPASPALLDALFTGIAWGTPGVLQATCAALAAVGVTPALLRPLPDLDTVADLAAAVASGDLPSDLLPTLDATQPPRA